MLFMSRCVSCSMYLWFPPSAYFTQHYNITPRAYKQVNHDMPPPPTATTTTTTTTTTSTTSTTSTTTSTYHTT